MAVHEFRPTEYYTTFAWREPALRIGDGDTVRTVTVDSAGLDADRKKVAEAPNPQTGPFWVVGAEPGDTLEVRLGRLWPNRDTGDAAAVLAANVVDPGYVAGLPARRLVTWQIDREKGTGTLADSGTKLDGYTLPLRPMLGCLGVAPAGGQAFNTMTADRHGGNMDYRGYVAGTTAYFPVAVRGALFSLGDGHAVQGAGEITGTGIEISFDVEFTAIVRKGWPINWPRGEDEHFIFTAGNARPLDQALQHATTEMHRWLMADWHLDAEAASLLMGECVDYEVGNVFDPAYTMICKLPKAALPGKRG